MANIHTIFAFDTSDSSMGQFFDNTLLDLLPEFYKNSFFNIFQITGDNFERSTLEDSFSQLNGEKFIFIAYAHGSNDAILCYDSHEKIIIKNVNCYFLGNSLVYTFCCHIGKELGEHLVSQNALTFIGYDSEVSYIIGLEQEFIDCANFAIKAFLIGDTIDVAVKKSKKYHTEVRNNLTSPIAKITISKNKNSMVLFGKQDLVIDDLINP